MWKKDIVQILSDFFSILTEKLRELFLGLESEKVSKFRNFRANLVEFRVKRFLSGCATLEQADTN